MNYINKLELSLNLGRAVSSKPVYKNCHSDSLNGEVYMTNSAKVERGTLNTTQVKKFKSFSNVSTQIRYLDFHGFTRGEIVKYITKHGLNRAIRYQHVRNVLITPITNPAEKF